KENNFLYRLISLKVQIERKLVARGSSQTVQQKLSKNQLDEAYEILTELQILVTSGANA
ncbi:unnamed protein product, partial [Rotaria sp. Silwood2]